VKGPAFAIFVALLCFLSLAALLLGRGALDVAAAPAVLIASLYAMWKAPLRYPAFVMTFLALTLENPGDVPGAGLWKSPIYDWGALFLGHMNLTLPIKALVFSGLDLMLLVMFGIALRRSMTGDRTDGERVSDAKSPLGIFAALCLFGASWMWLWGMLSGGADFGSSLWQVQRVVYLPILFFAFRIALRGPADADTLGGIVIAAACVKAALAIYIDATVPPPPNEPMLPYATTHADSMLWAVALTLIILKLALRYGRRRVALALCVVPLLVVGMVTNNRRIVWVEVIAALATVWALMPWTKMKLTIARVALLALPVVLIYLVFGWSHPTGAFRPVGVLRSVVDSNADASTSWRDWENYNLFYTLKGAPLLGTGYGHGYTEIVVLPDISASYSLYRHIPHNSILGLWAYGGLVGFSLLWALIPVGLFVAARAQLAAERPREQVIALGAIATVVVYLVHCYGDMGLGTWTSVFLVAPALALAEKLAVATGGFEKTPARSRRKVTAPLADVAAIVPVGSAEWARNSQRESP
jgi:hypothetical protein